VHVLPSRSHGAAEDSGSWHPPIGSCRALRWRLLERFDGIRTSHWPFKGDAVYWSVQSGDGVAEDVVWSYPEPFTRVEEIAGLLAFWAEKPGVTLEVNGQAA
jgi:hypothetical protein